MRCTPGRKRAGTRVWRLALWTAPCRWSSVLQPPAPDALQVANEIRDWPKTDFTFSAENENGPKMTFYFLPETETKTKTATYFRPKTKTKLRLRRRSHSSRSRISFELRPTIRWLWSSLFTAENYCVFGRKRKWQIHFRPKTKMAETIKNSHFRRRKRKRNRISVGLYQSPWFATTAFTTISFNTQGRNWAHPHTVYLHRPFAI